MTKELRERAENKSYEDLKIFYCKVWGNCTVEKIDYIEHIMRYLVMYLRYHKMNANIRIKAYQILAFLDYTKGQD